jgi:hypothetical protein
VQLPQSTVFSFSFRFGISRTESAAISLSADPGSSGQARLVGLVAGIGGAAAAVAVIVVLAVCIGRQGRCGTHIWHSRSVLSEDPENLISSPAGTLHDSLLAMTDGLPATGHLSSTTLAMCPTTMSGTSALWGFSDE